jgi:hypothetical protein
MSVLETPRIYFKGEVTWDPIVTNNYDTYYDEDPGKTVFPDVARKVKAFREEAINAVGTSGNWNPHGTHRVNFYNTAVGSYDLGAGVKIDDPFVTAAVNFTGMLVDLEPYGAFSSQLFFDVMQFGVDGGYRILAPRSSRVTARYINFARNTANQMIAGVASVVWQTSFAKADGLRIDAFDSAVLQRVAAALEPDDVLGLTVRFNAYRTIYYDNPDLTNGSPAAKTAAQGLAAKLKGGGFQPNPARSLLVGVIGLWRKGEPAHEPGDRALISAANSSLASAHARIEGTTLTLDFANSVPEIDKNLTKLDLGVLTVGVVDPASGAFTSLGSFGYKQYDREAYETSSGILTVPLTPGAAKNAVDKDLQLRDAAGTPLLAELPLRAIPATPNLYLDENACVTATFQLYNRGLKAASSVPLTLFQMDASGAQPDKSTPMTTDKNGLLELRLTGISGGGITAYVPSFSDADQPTEGINPQVSTYMYVRTHPADADIASLTPTWDNVYAKVLANWNAMAPCMDNWLKLDDPQQMRAYASLLKRLTDPAHLDDFLFMPVTRDMSAGQRALLYKFLDVVHTDVTEAAGGRAQVAVARLAQLSRAMRRGETA